MDTTTEDTTQGCEPQEDPKEKALDNLYPPVEIPGQMTIFDALDAPEESK